MTRTRLSVSLLDLGIIAPGQNGASILEQTLRLAQLADRLGYERLWLSEHHEAHFAWTGPEVVLATLAQATRRIGLGSAAVLLPLYSPLAVAEAYRTLSALSGNRIALGVCAGVPADPVALAALMENEMDAGNASRQLADKLAALVRYLDGDFPAGHRFANGATPCFAERPALWLMGVGRAQRRDGGGRRRRLCLFAVPPREHAGPGDRQRLPRPRPAGRGRAVADCAELRLRRH